jgi:heptosyltransferase-2
MPDQGSGGRGQGAGNKDPRPGIVVFAPNWLGDVVMALPAIADVRRQYGDARLVVAARRSVAPLFPLVPGIDDVVTLDGRDDAGSLRRASADVAILLPNSFSSAWLARAATIAERWGYATDLRRLLLTRAVPLPRTPMHNAASYQHLVHALGAPRGPLEPALRISDDSISAARALLGQRGWDGTRPVITIAPGAAYGTAKRWLPAYAATLAGRLVHDRGVFVALVGSGTDRDTTEFIASTLPPEAARYTADLAGATSLDALAGLLRLSAACVSNDSGTMHLAAAIGAPVVALFGPTREDETSPLPGPGGRARVLLHPVWCRPCMLRECPIDHRCMTRLTPDEVFSAVQEVCA